MSAVVEKNLTTIVLMTTVLCVMFMDICSTSVEYSPQRFWQQLVCMPVSAIVYCMMVRLDDGLFGWRPKGSLDNCPPCFLLCFCCGCVHGSCRFCWMAIVSKSDVHRVPTRKVFSVRCVGLYFSLFHLKRKCRRRGDDGTRMFAIRTRALLCAMLLI